MIGAIVALAAPALAAPALTLESYRSKAEKLAPPFPTVPGKTRCVCQTANSVAATKLGYLNSTTYDDMGDVTVNLVCAYPVFTPGVGTAYCLLFAVIK